MINLIVSVLAIALTAICAMASINYMPWWQNSANSVESRMEGVFSDALSRFKEASAFYGEEPTPSADADGGLNSLIISPFSKIGLPVPKAGFTWSYGVNSNVNSPYYGVKFFCLTPPPSGLNYGEYVGMHRAFNVAPASVIAESETSCGGAPLSTSNFNLNEFNNTRNVYFTIYVKWRG